MIGYLALGSNQGDSLANLQQARLELDQHGIQVLASSKLYETDPYGPVAQDNFLNAVVKIETALSPADLLATIHEIEAKLGRVRTIHWGPRTLDIDILLLGGLTIKTPDLTVPHPEIKKRAFVLIPLADVYDEATLFGEPLATLIQETGNQDEVRLKNKDW